MNEITTNEIVKINASDYGIESTKAKEIEEMFAPMLSKMKELETEYNAIINQPVSKELCFQAKELRLKYVKVRTGTAEIHKSLKDFYLKGGRFVDGWKNAQLFASQQIEESLIKIEKHYKILENERLEKLRADREAMLRPYTDVIPMALGHMEQAVWDNYLQGVKVAYEFRIAAEKKAGEERVAREKAEAKERERIRLENIRLKEEAEERERLAEIERKKQAAALAYQKAKAEKERRELLENARIEQERKDKELEAERKAVRLAQEKRDAELAMERAKAQKEREELEAKARKEREEREIIEARLKAKQEAELEAERKAVRLAQEKRDAELAMERARVQKEREELEAKARKEREERERIEAQLKAKQEAERKAEAARIANEKAEAKRLKLAPDKTKLLNFVQAINDLPRPEVKSIEAADIASKANIKLFEVANYIKDNANKL